MHQKLLGHRSDAQLASLVELWQVAQEAVMMYVRKAEERGHFNFGWLDTYHTFSFDQYYDPNVMGFRSLRVINEDRVQGGGGFPTHPHRDMEIITYVLEGALRHQDSMGNGSVIVPGEVQRMSAGTGITHSERNASETEPVHLLQIWIRPQQRGLTPSYEQKMFPAKEKLGRLRLIASPDGRDGAVVIHQDAEIYAAILNGEEILFPLRPERSAWVQVARGTVAVNGHELGPGDGAALAEQDLVRIGPGREAEILLFDLK
jgi:redox-sensitive bicupin YhaK (pirin superfamily)